MFTASSGLYIQSVVDQVYTYIANSGVYSYYSKILMMCVQAVVVYTAIVICADSSNNCTSSRLSQLLLVIRQDLDNIIHSEQFQVTIQLMML